MMPEAYSAQTLAYLGDAVFELCVREMLTAAGSRPVGELSRQSQQYVSAPAQARMYHAIFEQVTDEERAVMKRGRNLSPASRAKNAEMTDYRHATGLETLFGYLYKEGKPQRIREIFEWCVRAKGQVNDNGTGNN